MTLSVPSLTGLTEEQRKIARVSEIHPIQKRVRRWSGIRLKRPSLGPLRPTLQVPLLLLREAVDGYTHGGELQPGNLSIDFHRHWMDPSGEAVPFLHQVLHRQGLVGEAHIHHHGRVTFRRRQVDEAPLPQEMDAPSVAQGESLDEFSQSTRCGREGLQGGNIDLNVEVS